VRINDKFDIVLGLNRSLMHEPLKKNGFPASDDERGAIAGFYAVAVFKDGTRTFHAMSKEQVEQVRDNSRGYQMAKKYRRRVPGTRISSRWASRRPFAACAICCRSRRSWPWHWPWMN
jgi:hypothetical protein